MEIGVDAGFGSCYMAMAVEEYGGIVIGIDHEKKISIPMPDNFHFVEGSAVHTRTWVIVQSIVNTYGRIGLVYQDSSHHYQESHTEWGLYSQFLADGAIWICDDITPAFHDPLLDPPGKGMVQYFEELPWEKRLFPDVLHRGNTQGIVIVNG